MPSIRVLDQATIDKIAAGEVVERPASIAKELIENAIDAGATRITVEIRDGGISMLRVSDNGSGLAREEVRLAFMRHATSKLVSIRDLDTIGTYGFRGEALSSISAVSRVEMVTHRPEDISGTRCLIEGGREAAFEEVGAPDGTTIIVRDLFFNTPARAKFLRSEQTESSRVGAVVEEMAISHPKVAMNFIARGLSRVSTTGSGSVKDVIYSIYGKEIAAALVPVDYAEGGVRVTGFAAKPVVSRGNRMMENYFVNGRYVKSAVVAEGIEAGYGTMLMKHMYPFTCLFIDMPGKLVDVNVHPAKLEVRFASDKAILSLVAAAVANALAGSDMAVSTPLVENKKSKDIPLPASPRVPLKSAAAEAARDAERGSGGEGAAAAARHGLGSALYNNDQGAYRAPCGKAQAEGLEPPAFDRGSIGRGAGFTASGEQPRAAGEAKGAESVQGGAAYATAGSGSFKAAALERSGSEEKAPEALRERGASSSGMQPCPPESAPVGSGFERQAKAAEAAGGPGAGNLAGADGSRQTPAFSKEAGEASLLDGTATAPLIADGAAPYKAPVYTQQSFIPDSKEGLLSKERRIIGCAFKTYWIIESGKSLYMIDQHAAHEKVLYSRFTKAYKDSAVTQQLLMPPVVFTADSRQQELLEEYAEAFEKTGFSIEPFGGREYKISAVPYQLSSLGAKRLFIEMLDHLEVTRDAKKLDLYILKIATEACKAAVKGGDRLTVREAEALIDEMFTLDDPYHCPHGRPTVITFTEKELEKRFKRIV